MRTQLINDASSDAANERSSSIDEPYRAHARRQPSGGAALASLLGGDEADFDAAGGGVGIRLRAAGGDVVRVASRVRAANGARSWRTQSLSGIPMAAGQLLSPQSAAQLTAICPSAATAATARQPGQQVGWTCDGPELGVTGPTPTNFFNPVDTETQTFPGVAPTANLTISPEPAGNP